MKSVKAFGLAAIAALAVMALVGTSSAMASTALCKADEDPCAKANQVTEVHYKAEDMTILTSIMDYVCDALLLAKVSAPGESQTLEATELTYSSCNQGCTRTVEKEGTFTITRTGEELAEVIGEGFIIHVVCGSAINCKYAFNGLVGQFEGPLLTEDNGHITFQGAGLEKLGGLVCPLEALLDALFIASKPVYMSS